MNPTSDKPAKFAAVIGAMRCGTTTLYHALRQVPGVSVTRIKEPDYFIAEKSHYRGEGWYSGLFPDLGGLCVDVSPNYAKCDVFAGVPERIFAYSPHARIIYIVRDPVERALSEYSHQISAGVRMPPMEQLLDTPEGRHILSTSAYATQLHAYRRVFPEDQILVVDMDRLVQEPGPVMSEILAFCGHQVELGPLELGVENDRKSVSKIPKAWLALRRTRLGDLIRDLIPPALHRPLKRLGAQFSGQGSGDVATPDADAQAVLVSQLRKKLQREATEFRQLTGMNLADWSV